jgi:SOS-response transcriptional repressor LexA
MAPVIPIGQALRSAVSATWSLLEIARPGSGPVPFGILLVDEKTGSLTLRLRDVSEIDDLDELEADFLDLLEGDLRLKAAEWGGQALLNSLEHTLSHLLRISDRTTIAYTGDPQKIADRLFDEHVDGAVRPFETHLPLYNLRAAATKFGEGMQSEQEGWLRVPRHLAQPDMFVARVVGRSMEPLIPDGSLCVFRSGVTGTRQGKRLLVEQFGETDFSARYTVKRYTSRKKIYSGGQGEHGEDGGEGDGSWEHERIRLEPLNREFPGFDLGPDEFRVIAEFIAVLDPGEN